MKSPESRDPPDPGRRQVLKITGAGMVVAAGAGSMGWLWQPGGIIDATADNPGVFRKGAPPDATFESWKRQGWVKEAYHYRRLGANVQCSICPNHCLLEPGDRSHCRTRVNRDGTLYTLAYANPCTFHVDPVEKKPLFHFLPGSKSFSIAVAGCVLRCMNCQNWDISQKTPEETKHAGSGEFRVQPGGPMPASVDDIARMTLMPEDVVAMAETTGCKSVSYTYSEPVAWYEYTLDTCRRARERKMRNVLVTSGYIKEQPLRELAGCLDGAHVDLKGFDDSVYMKLNSGHLQPVLDTLRTLKDCGVWFEIINLIVPTYTDNPVVIRQMCNWLVEHIGPDVPLHFSRFHPAHRLAHLPPTPLDVLERARLEARSAGLRYVYVGNARGIGDAGTTYCPSCREPIVERDIFSVTAVRLVNGKCALCGAVIPGKWAE